MTAHYLGGAERYEGTDAMDYAIEAKGLVKTYRGDVRALDGVSLVAETGTVFSLLGPNGAGKSTTVKILTTLSRPDAGEARVAGYDVVREAAKVRLAIGCVAQKSGLDPAATGRENLILQGRVYGMRGRELKSRAQELLERFGLADAADRTVRTYSGGMQRKLDVAVGLMHRPQVLFLDEPTTGLDPQARHNFWDLIRAIKAERRTVLLTTHYMEEAYFLCDVVAIMDHGRIIAEGPPSRLLKEHFDDVVLELPREDFGIDPATFPLPVLLAGDRVEISTADVELALRALLDRGIPVRHLQIRPRNLEDLFLELTGRELRT